MKIFLVELRILFNQYLMSMLRWFWNF